RIAARHATAHAELLQMALHVVEAQPDAEGLYEARAAADDVVEAVGVAAGDVAGAQLLDPLGRREPARTARVADHPVRAAVDELAPLVRFQDLAAAVVEQTQGAARDRDADGIRMLRGPLRRQIADARRRLGLAVHHEHSPALPGAFEREALHQRGR